MKETLAHVKCPRDLELQKIVPVIEDHLGDIKSLLKRQVILLEKQIRMKDTTIGLLRDDFKAEKSELLQQISFWKRKCSQAKRKVEKSLDTCYV